MGLSFGPIGDFSQTLNFFSHGLSLGTGTHRALLAVLSRVSDILPLVAMAAAADAVTASAANLSVLARRHARAVGLLTVTRIATPSRQAIAGTALALAASAADLKRTKGRRGTRRRM